MTIRTPEDEIDRPGYFYPPFNEGWWYQGATYAGHSDFATDFNRRTKNGGWLDDRGDPVRAIADGTVAEVQPADGTVFLNHFGGTYRSEYRHMEPVTVKEGQKVQRGDILGRIGEAGNAPNGTHLHHRHFKKVNGVWKPIKMRFYDRDIAASVFDSDTRPASGDWPGTVMLEGPPPRATWESAAKAYREALAAQKAQTELATSERNEARQELAIAEEQWGKCEALLTAARAAEQLAKDAADGLRTELTAAQAALKACQEQPTPSCDAAVKAARDADATALEELAQRWRAEG
jgi:hypothetical protein